MRRKGRGLQAPNATATSRSSPLRPSRVLEASGPRSLKLNEWEEIRGEITAVERTPVGLMVTVKPEAAELAFYASAAGAGADSHQDLEVGAVIEALQTPTGVRVRRLDRVRSRSASRNP